MIYLQPAQLLGSFLLLPWVLSPADSGRTLELLQPYLVLVPGEKQHAAVLRQDLGAAICVTVR